MKLFCSEVIMYISLHTPHNILEAIGADIDFFFPSTDKPLKCQIKRRFISAV